MQEIAVINAHAAALDIGSEKIHGSVAGGRLRVFGTFTGELYALRDWLKGEAVETVAMEATGIYWLTIYEVLEAAGFEVVVTSGRHVKNLPGRKTDMSDCQWIATLHAHGLLRAGFVPQAHIRQLQDYMRLRSDHISMAAAHVQHMQKALERMNLKLHDVISQLTGVSGLAMIEAILGGERDPERLVALVDAQVRKRKGDRLRASLHGNWKKEHLFGLRQAYELWQVYQSKVAECDQQIAVLLREQSCFEEPTSPACGPPPPPPAGGKGAPKIKPPRHNAPRIENLHQMLLKLCGGRDATQLPGLTDYSVLTLVSEVGCDLSRWKTEKAFTAWLGLAPASHQSGKRRGRVSRQRNRAGRLFCTLARSLARSVDKALGGFYRRLRARRGGLIANQALARKLAALYWRVFVKGLDYVEAGLEKYQQRILAQEQHLLKKLASKLGFTIHPEGAVHG